MKKRYAPAWLCSLFVVYLFLCGGAAHAWEAEVVTVSDGDTLTVKQVATDKKIKVRLYGIDAPESKWAGRWQAQPYSAKAKQHLQKLMPVGSKVSVVDMGFDRYTRTIGAVVALPDGTVAQEEMLSAGLAWVYEKYCKDCRQWKSLEKAARAAKRGLWQDNAPTPPWVWRK